MDPFTENILARARERQKLLQNLNESENMPLREKSAVSQPNLTEIQHKNDLKETASDSNIPSKFDPSVKENLSDGNLTPKFKRQNSKTRVSSSMPGSPQPQSKTLNIQKENFNMEIKVTSADDVHVEVEIEERDDNSKNEDGGLREESKNRLQRLGKLYAGGEDADISSPITRNEKNFSLKETSDDKTDKSNTKKSGLSRLAHLAETINQWEDQVQPASARNVEKKTPKRGWKAPAPQPPSANNSPVKKPASPVKVHSNSQVAETTPKQIKWDKNVLDTLESQGFQRTTSDSRLVYAYNDPQGKSTESPPAKKKEVDPALMSVSERKALFEKNKGVALVPKAAFGMAAPVKQNEPKKVKSSPKKTPAPKPPVPVEAAVPQATGIASKMAALLEEKSTISQSQIESKVKEQRQKEMDMLMNRFNKNKETIEEEEEEESDDEDATEETAMISEKKAKIVEKRISGGKRLSSTSDSAQVLEVLEDVKRIRVSPPKAGKLYPNLSDIEATATDTENATNNNSSSDEESDGGANTSFGRDILQAVCKNQTPQKRPIYDESTASDISSVLDEMDEYLEDQDSVSSGPTPPKHNKSSHNDNTPQPSNSFHYKSYSPVKTKFQSPRKSSDLPLVVEGENVIPLTHTVSFYRKQQTEIAKTPVRQVTRQPLIEENSDNSNKDISEDTLVKEKIKQLQDEVAKQQTIISQTSQALNYCYGTREFAGSTEQVEAEKVLLVATHTRLAALNELQRLEVEGTIRPKSGHAENLPLEKGTLKISNIILPLKEIYVKALAAAGGKGHHVLCLIKCGEQVICTKLVSTVARKDNKLDFDLIIPDTIILNNIHSDFTVTFEVYCLQAQEEYFPHEVKYHINSKKSNSKLTPKKSKDSRFGRSNIESPGGPQAVRSPAFDNNGYVVFSVQTLNKRNWTLNNIRPVSPLEGTVEMRITYDLAVSMEHRGFLTMFDDVSGFGAWHRRWCLLKNSTLSYWKYPDDERKMAPIDTLDLKNCITKTVGPVSREICARLHTFLLERERMSYPSDKDTLVMICKGDKTIIRHLLSADTKEERIQWCNKFNAALSALQIRGN